MIAIVCLGERGGMMFNGRRQSRDRAVIQDILRLAAGKRLLTDAYSAPLFQQAPEAVAVCGDPLAEAGDGELCFVEGRSLAPFLPRLEGLIVYRWNRDYPADRFLDISVPDGQFKLTETAEFAGFSHEKITKEVYAK